MDLLSDRVLRIRLSQEELAYLVWRGGAKHLPGLAHNVNTILASGTGADVTAVVERSLLARGILTIQEDRSLAVTTAIRDTIQLCVSASFIVVVAVDDEDKGFSSLQVYSISPNVTVSHELPIAGIHDLTAVCDSPFDLAAVLKPFFSASEAIRRRVFLQISSRSELDLVTQEYEVCSWEELAIIVEAIGEPIRALSQLQIESQP